jgi:hypothetical protein
LEYIKTLVKIILNNKVHIGNPGILSFVDSGSVLGDSTSVTVKLPSSVPILTSIVPVVTGVNEKDSTFLSPPANVIIQSQIPNH